MASFYLTIYRIGGIYAAAHDSSRRGPGGSEKCKDLESPGFLVGNIAPDAIHMRENTTLKDKSVTHLITDYIWFHTIFRRFEKSMPDRDDEDFIRASYYYDTDHLDTKLYHWSDWTSSVMHFPGGGDSLTASFPKLKSTNGRKEL